MGWIFIPELCGTCIICSRSAREWVVGRLAGRGRKLGALISWCDLLVLLKVISDRRQVCSAALPVPHFPLILGTMLLGLCLEAITQAQTWDSAFPRQPSDFHLSRAGWSAHVRVP